VLFSAESIFAFCQAVYLAVWLLGAKIQGGCLKITRKLSKADKPAR